MASENNDLLTPEQAREWLKEHGLTHRAVAELLVVKIRTVRDVLYGKNHGSYNEGHKVAVALRIKARPRSAPPPMIPQDEIQPRRRRAADQAGGMAPEVSAAQAAPTPLRRASDAQAAAKNPLI